MRWIAASFLCILIALSPIARAQSVLPDADVPQGFAVASIGGSGRVLSTRLSGKITSALNLAKGMLEPAGEYFDSVPVIGSSIGNADDTGFQALFNASLGSQPVAGLMIVQLQDGGGTASFIFDRPEEFAATLGKGNNGGNGGSAYGDVPRQQFDAPDGKARVVMPQTWQMLYSMNGAVDFAGPNGEGGSLGAAAPFFSMQVPYMDPMGAYQAMAQMNPQGFQPTRLIDSYNVNLGGMPAVFILAEGSFGGQPYTDFCLIGTQNMGDQWLVYRSNVGAPSAVFRREFRTLMDIWNSWGVSSSYTKSVLDDAMNNMKEASDIYSSASSDASDATSRSNKAWSLTIQGNDMIENTQSGQRYELPNNQLNSVVENLNQQDGGTSWRVVPMSDY